MADYPVVTITMANGDTMKARLYPDIAPNSVANFIALANDGFYDGLTFHRVIPGFMIQGGCPDGSGMGGPGWQIRGEFTQNGFDNPLKHKRGILSMARSQNMDSAGSQFFVMVADSPHLDGGYAAFGEVIEGIEAADTVVNSLTPRRAIQNGTPRDEVKIVDKNGKEQPVHAGNADMPLEPQIIESIRVETFGEEYPLEKL